MFRDAHTRQVMLADHRLDAFGEDWRRTADNWFDGSVESVDRRLAKLDRIIAFAGDATGRLGNHIRCAATLPELRVARDHLAGLRERMLTGAGPLSRPLVAAVPGARPFTDFPAELLYGDG